MIAWIGQVPALLAALALLVVPGLPVAMSLRGVQGVVRVGAAITTSLAILGAASLVAPMLGLAWGLLPVALVAVVVWLVAVLLWFIDRHRPAALAPRVERSSSSFSRSVGPWPWIALAAAFLGWVIILALGIGGPGHPSQLYDGIFHINAVEYIARTGDASPLHMTMVVPGEDTSFYPTLWHALVSLVVPISGSIVAATNVTTIAVIAFIWPVALSVLTAVAFPRHPRAAAWAPLVSFGFSVFPLGFLNWGVLYPSLLGTVLIPTVIAMVLLACASVLSWPARTLRVLAALAALGATTFAHPSAALAAVALLVPYFLWWAWTTIRASGVATRIIVTICVVGGLAALAAVWGAANVTTNRWLPTQTMAQSLGEVAFLSPVGRTAGALLGVLATIGVWRVAKDRLWWVLGSYAVSVVFFLMAAWFPILSVRSAFVGVWYDDTTRVGALIAIWGLPLAGLGAALIADALGRWWRAGNRRRVLVIIVLLAVAAASHLLMLRNDIRFMRGVSFQFGEASQGLSRDEAELFDEIDLELPEDSLVIGDPLTGAGLLFAYTGRDVVFPHISGTYGPDAALLAGHFVDGGAEVCEAAERLGVTHALDFGDVLLYQNNSERYAGLHDLKRSTILTEIDRTGDAVLYEVTGCD